MGKGSIGGGIAALIIGVIIAVFSSAGMSYTESDSNLCNSGIGQFGQFIDEDAKQNCATLAGVRGAAGIGTILGYGLVVLGIILAGVGGIQLAISSRKRKPEYETQRSSEQVASLQTKMFCRYCGRVRSAAGLHCSECGKATKSPSTVTKRCVHCYATMTDDSVFCANCGGRI